MNNEHSEIIKHKISSKYIKEIELISNKKKSNNNSRDKIKTNKEINLKQMINKNNNPELYNKKNEYQKNKKVNKPKTPLLNSMKSNNSINKNPQSTIEYNDNAVRNYLNRNDFKLNMYTKENKNKKFITTFVSPLFDYNIKNRYKNNNIRLNIKNNNSKPIKVINNDGYQNLYKNKNKYKKCHISNSSVDYKSSSIYENNSNRDNITKRNTINSKNEKKNNSNFKSNNSHKKNRYYISYTPDCTRKAPFIKKKLSNDELNVKNIKKEDINIKLEKEIKNKIISEIKTNKNKNNYINNVNGTTTSGSRNRIDDIKSTNYSNSQSQKNIFRFDNYSNDIYNKNINDKPEYNTIHTEKKYSHTKSKINYKKYYSLLEKKIQILNEEIEDIKGEERTLILQLINYKEKENECNYVRLLREEIKKYKNVIEKSKKACEEYSLEILRIKNIIGNNSD